MMVYMKVGGVLVGIDFRGRFEGLFFEYKSLSDLFREWEDGRKVLDGEDLGEDGKGGERVVYDCGEG